MSATTDRIVEISEGDCLLKVENDQLIVSRRNSPNCSIPLEEIAVLVISNSWVTYSHSVLSGLAQHRGVLIVCDARHLPIAMSLPLYGHSLPAERHRQQIAATEPVKKRLWQSLIRSKIRTQAAVLEELTGDDAGLSAMAERVRSGDPENLEGQAARRYWPKAMGSALFCRTYPDGEPPNHLLDYGYAILRAIAARAIVCSGMNPTLGIHHKNRSNSFCLADDLMEPFRPLVDRAVAQWISAQGVSSPLNRASKAALISPLLKRMRYKEQSRTLFDVLLGMTANVTNVYEGTASHLEMPESILELSDE